MHYLLLELDEGYVILEFLVTGMYKELLCKYIDCPLIELVLMMRTHTDHGR